MNVILVGRDVAPSQAFKILAGELRGCDWQVGEFLGNGKPLKASLQEIRLAAKETDIIVLGMSSSPERSAEELFAGKFALEYKKPLALYADNRSAWQRPHFQDLLAQANLLFVVDNQASAAAQNRFPNLQVVASGNPTWEQYNSPVSSKQEARRQLGFGDEEKLILAPLTKTLTVNLANLNAIIEAIFQSVILQSLGVKLVVSLHPGEEESQQAFYQELAKFSPVPISLIAKGQAPPSHQLVAADLVIVINPEGSVCTEAMFRRVPVIHYATAISSCWNQAETDSTSWTQFEAGTGLQITQSIEELTEGIKSLGLGLGARTRQMLQSQEEVYPKPPVEGAAVRIMAEYLVKLLSGA